MNQDNTARLKEEFRFAAKGARCRTATFINPNFAALGQFEWMEGECANGRDWDIKMMKIIPGYGTGDELIVEQKYLPEYRGLTFGAVVLKMAEYQRAQKALGFLVDENDAAAQAGAPHFHDIAGQAGIVFNTDGDPVAPVQGLIVQPGRFPISAFKAAAACMERHDILPVTAGLSSARSFDEEMQVAKIVDILNGMMVSLERHATESVLKWGSNPFRPGYFYFTKSFDSGFEQLRRLEQPLPVIDSLDVRLSLFKFHAFRIAGAWALQAIKNGGSYYGERRSKAVVEDALHRCQDAVQSIKPELGTDMSIMDFSKAITVDPLGAQHPDLQPLKDIVSAIEALPSPEKTACRLKSAHFRYNFPFILCHWHH